MSLKKTRKELEQLITSANPYAGRVGLVYARVSSKRQEIEGSGLESQEKRCVSDLTSIGVPHEKTFPDTFTGGGDFMQRPAMRALITYIDAHPHKKFLVIFDDLSRFARDVEFHIKLRATFRSRDVLLRCLNYNFDDTPEGEYAELIMAGGAELFRKQNRRQVIQKMKACLERGYEPFARRRGYDRIKDPLLGKVHTPNKDGHLMKNALEKFAIGNLVRKVDVARFLHERGYWKNSKRPAESFIDEVTELLTDVFHAGYVEYPAWGVTRRKGNHKGLITLETYELIQKRLRKEETGTRIRIDTSPEFPMRGLVLCPSCQQKLTGAFSKGRSKKYAYYYCSTKGCELRSKAIARDRIERDFRELLRQYRVQEEVSSLVESIFARVWKEEANDFRKQQSIRAQQRIDLEQKVKDLTELVRTAKSKTLRDAYEAELEAAAKELADTNREQNVDLKVPYRTALNKSLALLKNPVSVWDIVDTIEKHQLFFFLFEGRLEYSKAEGYRTAQKLATTKVFEEFCEQNSDYVDLGGIEPPPRQCECRVVPLDYRP